MPKPIDGPITNPGRLALGQYGSIVASDTAAHAPAAADPLAATDLAWVVIDILTDAVFTALTSATSAKCPAPTVTAITFPAGFRLYGNFSTFTLASGSCVAYAGPRL